MVTVLEDLGGRTSSFIRLEHLEKCFLLYYRKFSEEVEVLIELDTSFVDISKAPKDVKPSPHTWYRKFGNGIVFYTAFDHFTKT